MTEVQTRTAPGSAEPEWIESLYFEVSEQPAAPESVEVSLYGYNAIGFNTLIGQSIIPWASWKEASDTHSTACWLLKGQIIENTEIPLMMRIDSGSDRSPRKNRFAQALPQLQSAVTTRYSREAPVSQSQGRSRYWRHQEDTKEEQFEEVDALKSRERQN